MRLYMVYAAMFCAVAIESTHPEHTYYDPVFSFSGDSREDHEATRQLQGKCGLAAEQVSGLCEWLGLQSLPLVIRMDMILPNSER